MREKKLSAYTDLLKSENEVLLKFLKAKYPLFHNSNFFFRDFQFGIRKFLEKKRIEVNYQDAEYLAGKMSEFFENRKVFIKINNMGWKINYNDFTTTAPGDPF